MEFLALSNISIAYGNNKITENFNHVFCPGVTFITGANGIGKSTLLSIISTVTVPDTGDITCSIAGERQAFNIIKHGNFVADKPDFYPFITVKEFFKLMKKIKKLPFDIHESALFDDFALAKHLHTPFHALSFGTKKKVFLLLALATGAPVIILDEPTNGLDAPSHEVLSKHLKISRQNGDIIIMSSHDREFMGNFDAEVIAL